MSRRRAIAIITALYQQGSRWHTKNRCLPHMHSVSIPILPVLNGPLISVCDRATAGTVEIDFKLARSKVRVCRLHHFPGKLLLCSSTIKSFSKFFAFRQQLRMFAALLQWFRSQMELCFDENRKCRYKANKSHLKIYLIKREMMYEFVYRRKRRID